MEILSYDELRTLRPTLPVEILQRLGSEPDTRRPLVCDGKVGPKTRGALYLNPAALEQGHKLPLLAMDELLQGAREVAPPGMSASNRGPWVNKYCRLGERASLTVDRGAWCAFYASWCLNLWAVEYLSATFQRVGGARRLVKDHLSRVQLDAVLPGDLVAWESKTRPAPYGHVGIVALRSGSMVWTVEGNVDLRPGLDGVAARCFDLDLTRSDGARPLYAGRLILP